MKLRKKIILCFTFIVSISMIICVVGALHLRDVTRQYEQQIAGSVPLINSLHNILKGGLRTIGATSEIVMLRESKNAGLKLKSNTMEEEFAELQVGYRLLVDHHEIYNELIGGYEPDDFEQAAVVDFAVDRLVNSSIDLIEMKQGVVVGKQLLALKEELEEADNNFTKVINDSIKAAEDELAVMQSELIQKNTQMRGVIVFLVVLLVSFGTGSLIYLLKSLSRGVAQLNEVSDNIAQGNLDIKLDDNQTDEFGELIGEFQKMANEISSARNFADKSLLKLKRYANDLKDKNKEYEEFVFVASHDLQEPLRKIMTYASRLQKGIAGQVDEESEKFLNKTIESTTFLREKLDMLSEYSRIVVDEENFSKVRLDEIVEKAAARYMGVMDNNDTAFKIDELPVIEGERELLEQMFNCLFDNSCKFKDNKPLEVKVSSEIDEKENLCRIIFEDNGCGFDQKYAGEIFRVFHSLDNIKFGGLGMGLAIVKRIVEVHRGSIEVESSPGDGARFTLVLPMYQEDRIYG